MRVDSFEYVSENDEYIIFNVVIVYPLTNFAIDEDYHYHKENKTFTFIEDDIKILLNNYYVAFLREGKLERIIKE